jgi:hypothetical protein
MILEFAQMMIKEIRNRCILMHLQLKFTSGKDIGPNVEFFISLKGEFIAAKNCSWIFKDRSFEFLSDFFNSKHLANVS